MIVNETSLSFEDQHAITLKTGWISDGGHCYYLQEDGSFDARIIDLTVGEPVRGWINDSDYLDPTTAAMQTGGQQLGNKWYYLRSSGPWQLVGIRKAPLGII